MGFKPKTTTPRTLQDLEGKNIVVYDLETKNLADEVGGWGDREGMGISVGCAFDYREMRYHVYLDDNMHELVFRLNEPGTMIVAFNHIQFDNKMLRACVKDPALLEDEQLNNYDMIKVAREGVKASGGRSTPGRAGFKLDNHLEACRLPMKTGDGMEAPRWYKEGRLGRVVDYCLTDAAQERALFEHMYIHGRAANGAKPDGFAVRVPDLSQL